MSAMTEQLMHFCLPLLFWTFGNKLYHEENLEINLVCKHKIRYSKNIWLSNCHIPWCHWYSYRIIYNFSSWKLQFDVGHVFMETQINMNHNRNCYWYSLNSIQSFSVTNIIFCWGRKVDGCWMNKGSELISFLWNIITLEMFHSWIYWLFVSD